MMFIMENSPACLVDVKNLHIGLVQNKEADALLKNVSFSIEQNQILAVVGESGSGKSICAKAIMGLLDPNALYIEKGEILFKNKALMDYDSKDFRNLRINEIGMVFQEPMTALNPTMCCGDQVLEAIALREPSKSKKELKQRVVELFEQVRLPDPSNVYKKYPHEISGGQKQRVIIAMAISCNPSLLIADEPTTALDVTVQKDIIELLKELQAKTKMSIMFISHDLGLVSCIASKVMVMYKGSVVEQGSCQEVFNNPQHSYTKALLHARPSSEFRLNRLPTVEDYQKNKVDLTKQKTEDRLKTHDFLYQQTPILSVKNVVKDFSVKKSLFSKKKIRVLNNISFELFAGETLGLVGQSGCGKSTLGNLILKLEHPTSGQVLFGGHDICSLSEKQMRPIRKDIQIIFQDPYSSLNPRIPIGEAILEVLQIHSNQVNRGVLKAEVERILINVGLKAEDYSKYAHEFSGGQRQRVGIARCIAVKPKIVVCDESVSALDISVQAQVLNLLNDLKKIYGFAYLFISHDLAVVKYMSDRILVMDKGCIVELQEADALFENPQHLVTKQLIASSIF